MTTSLTLSTMTPGNLALCRKSSSDSESPIVNCLGWGANVEILLEPLATNHLNWRYENGLLRSVGADGFATDLCLGPHMASLDTQTLHPYELVLQDCPGSSSSSARASSHAAVPDLTHQSNGHQENIFARHSATQRSASTTISMEPTTPSEAIDPDENPREQEDHSKEQQQEQEQEQPQPQDRHMRFLMGADGRIRSLAPVLDSSTTTTKDLAAEQPFCVTAVSANVQDSQQSSSKAYLIPCFDHEDETHVYTSKSNELGTEQASTPRAGSKQIFKGNQQIFELSPNSSFESFLLNWPVMESDETDAASSSSTTAFQEIQLAYQLGYHGPLASEHGMTLDKFDSFAIRVTNSGQSQNFQSDVLETAIDQQSDIVSYPTSSFGNSQAGVAKMGAYLVGRSSTENIPIGLLASTSFEVYTTNTNGTTTRDAPTTPMSFEQQQQQQGIDWPWVHIVFWGCMLCLAILLKLHSICRPNHKDHKWKNSLRESITTVDTNAATLASQEVTREQLALSSSPKQQEQPQQQEQQPQPRDSFSYHHHHQRRRSSRRDSKARMAMAQRAMQELNQHRTNLHSNHSRISYNLNSNHSRSYSQNSGGLPYSNHSREGPGSPTSVTRIDETLRTTDLSETNYLDDIESIDIESDEDDHDHESIDIESDDDHDLKADTAYEEEYNDGDLEAQALGGCEFSR